MTESPTTGLAERLAEAWRTGTPVELSPELVPTDADMAYRAQSALIERLVPRLGPIVGWKVGAASPSAVPNAAPLLADLVQPSPARFGGARLRVRGLEAELAFRFGRDLPPRASAYDQTEVAAAIQSLHPAIELVDSRLSDWQAASPLARLADTQSNGGFCFGPAISDWQSVGFLTQKVVLSLDGRAAAEAEGGNAAGHPLRLLAWLANHTAALGRGLKAGDIVTTGSHTPLIFAHSNSTAVADFIGLGRSSLDISDT